MLNTTSKEGISEILSRLDHRTLFTLASTVTHGLLKNTIHDRQEAETAIINYSQDALKFLKRKVVTREILFSYLHSKNVSVDLPVTKNDLIERIAILWNISSSEEKPVEPTTTTVNPVLLLAEQFSQWFYSELNKDECINSDHFFTDAHLKITIYSSNTQVETEDVKNNPEEIVQQLFQVRMKYKLHFNPNLTQEGVQGKMDAHGLVLVLTCGTLHSDNTCVGIFEQIFVLARDPFSENNWKIKRSELKLTNQSGTVNPPRLQDTHNDDADNFLSIH